MHTHTRTQTHTTMRCYSDLKQKQKEKKSCYLQEHGPGRIMLSEARQSQKGKFHIEEETKEMHRHRAEW